MTLYEACNDLVDATIELIWNYGPEFIFAAGILVGMLICLVLVLVIHP
jgi:hypothetical protein